MFHTYSTQEIVHNSFLFCFWLPKLTIYYHLTAQNCNILCKILWFSMLQQYSWASDLRILPNYLLINLSACHIPTRCKVWHLTCFFYCFPPYFPFFTYHISNLSKASFSLDWNFRLLNKSQECHFSFELWQMVRNVLSFNHQLFSFCWYFFCAVW